MKDDFGAAFNQLEESLKDIPRQIGVNPKAILVISGHWEEDAFTVMASPRPPMVYDYSGFPEHTYHVKYSAPGSPELAKRVQSLIAQAGFDARLDLERGFDHGTFAPLVVMYPKADVPIIQLSLRNGYDPEEHLKIGRALAPLRDEGVLIVGSGLTYHNLRRFDASAKAISKGFDDWLYESMMASTPNERSNRLKQWEQAPFARLAHPQEDHLIPLMVAVGAAESEKATRVYFESDFMGGITVSSYRLG
jgi:aromatic ring-opening dioxygenase catalytic subunit (LigB family)